MPRYAISDIHGCPKTFLELLKKVSFSKGDELFLLGDYIDRGPDSYGVIQAILKLQAEGHTVRCLRGNHEQMLIDAYDQRRPPWDYRPASHQAEEVLDWMRELSYYFETPGYILVHAGLNFAAPDPLSDTQGMLWSRYWEADIDRRWLGDRIVVYGHTPSPMLEINRQLDHMQSMGTACIDTGCAYEGPGMGYLTALNLDTQEPTFLRRID